MEEGSNKTIVCSVLFLDIAEYSRKQVAGQITLKEGFNSFLSKAIASVPVNDRIILDTGDGAAISFLGDVGDALKVALSLRESFFHEGVLMAPPLLVRMGINLGPVRLVRDINGQPNIVGDGINVAQRIMGFADTGQILVSRSYYDAVSRLSQDYAGMFHYQGSRTDKHVREHEIYAIGYPGELTDRWKLASGNIWQAASSVFQKASGVQRALYASIAALAMLVAVLLNALRPSPAPQPQVVEAPVQPVAAPEASGVAGALPKAVEHEAGKSESTTPATEKKPVVAAEADRKPATAAGKGGKPKAAQPSQGEPRQAFAAKEPLKQPVGPEGARKSKPTIRTLEETAAVEQGAAAHVNLAVSPWGEIYLDGRMQGVSPPLVELEVVPGKHEIEIRNTTFPPYIEKFQLKANEKIKITYKFSN
ncbi:MAG: adenylate/guanylate cyclase [Gallionellaceae bacterium]|nr:MAG: adenylate/guanylate cyclase [Gallionellaceae bacterium]